MTAEILRHLDAGEDILEEFVMRFAGAHADVPTKVGTAILPMPGNMARIVQGLVRGSVNSECID
jgi:hypothetical protein